MIWSLSDCGLHPLFLFGEPFCLSLRLHVLQCLASLFLDFEGEFGYEVNVGEGGLHERLLSL